MSHLRRAVSTTKLRSRRFRWDVIERTLWTGAEAAVGYISVDALDIDKKYTFIAAAILALLKSLIAQHVGNPKTASTLPEQKDPATPVVVQHEGGA
jgi:hypothetical protein